MNVIDQHWGLVLLGSSVAGVLLTVLVLRVRASKISGRLKDELGAGELVWGAQARRRTAAGRWGAAGRLIVTAHGELRFEPFPSDRDRGAALEVWDLGEAKVTYCDRRRDITGLMMQTLIVTPEHGSPQQFGSTAAVGELPGTWTI